MTRNRDHDQSPQDSDDEFDAIAASTGLEHFRPRVCAQWGAFLAEFEVWFGDDIPVIARWKVLDEACALLAAGLDPDCVEIRKTSHAWVAQAWVGGIEVTVPFAPGSDWRPLVGEQVFAMVVAAFATDPWRDISWVEYRPGSSF